MTVPRVSFAPLAGRRWPAGRMRGSSASQMTLAALLRQCDLPLPLPIALAVLVGADLMAMDAGDAFLVKGRQEVLRRQRLAAGVAERVLALRKAMSDGDAFVEDEAGTVCSRYFRMPPLRW